MPLSAVAARKLAQQKLAAQNVQPKESVSAETFRAPPAAEQTPGPTESVRSSRKRKRPRRAEEPEVITSDAPLAERLDAEDRPAANASYTALNGRGFDDEDVRMQDTSFTPLVEGPLDLMDTDEELANTYSSSDESTYATSMRDAPSRSRIPRYTAVDLSTAKKDRINYSDSSATISLAPGERVAAVGQYELSVRKGTITVYGAILHASSNVHRIYAPSSHALPVIQCIQNPYGGDPAAEVVLYSCKTGIHSLAALNPGFDKLWNDMGPRDDTLDDPYSFQVLWSSTEDILERPLRTLQEPNAWKSLAANLINIERPKPPVVLVCGPKGTGKSTITRFLTNAFLCSQKYDTVAYLDIDPGQPEYRPPGDLSLCLLKDYNFGPSYCHPNCIEGKNAVSRAHHFGSITPRDNPEHYLACVMDLYRTYQAKHPGCPLLINCSGWIMGSGLESLEAIIAGTRPSNVVYTSVEGLEEVQDILSRATQTTNSQLHTLASIEDAGRAQRTSADLRAMLTMSYFHATDLIDERFRWNSTPIDEMPSEIWSYAGSNPIIDAITPYTDYVVPKFFEYLVEMSILSVVAVYHDDKLAEELEFDRARDESSVSTDEDTWHEFSDANISHELQDQTVISTPSSAERALRRTKTGLPYYFRGTGVYTPLDPNHSQSLGQVLVRSIDAENQCLHVVTPVSNELIAEHKVKGAIIVLVKGRLDKPEWAHLEPYHVGLWREVEYEKWKSAAVAAGMPKNADLAEEDDHMEFDVEAWAKKTPWVSLVKEGDHEWRRKNRVWKVRRNLETSDGKK